jgi:hypothetical protein
MMREAAILLARLAERQKDSATQAKYQDFDRQLESWMKNRFTPLNTVVNSLDAGHIKRHAGDVFKLASRSPERVWRVEALMKVGRYKYNAGSTWDQLWAKRFLAEPARVGEQDATAHPDRAVAAAARLARDLTPDGYNQIDLVD